MVDDRKLETDIEDHEIKSDNLVIDDIVSLILILRIMSRLK